MKEMYKTFTKILREELITALGCTEPIALALAGAKCIETLGEEPDSIEINVSGNIIKNVQGVIIPGTSQLKGIELSVLLGAVVKNSKKKLEVLSCLTTEQIDKAKALKDSGICQINHIKGKPKLYIEVVMKKGDSYAIVEIMHQHTNITRISKNGENIIYNPCQEEEFNSALTDRSLLSIKNILDYASNVEIDEIKPFLSSQVSNNLNIATEGFNNDFGLSTGRILLENANGSVKERMKAFASSGSDARMSGCDLPVVINSGSGNQGLTISSPVYSYCKDLHISEDRMYRALVVANLIPIHLKTRIGRLSAFCGAVTAGIGVGTALTYLAGGTNKQIGDTIKNSLANLTGVICDGAKPSCAIKIASSVDAAYMAHQLAMKGKVVESGTGIIYGNIEDTIKNMAEIAHDAMVETDDMILKIMLAKEN